MMLVGTGGTACAMASMDQELKYYEPDKIQGCFPAGERICNIHASLYDLGKDQLKNFKGLDAGREDIIMAGVEIYKEVLATIDCEGMIVSYAGLLEGILLSTKGN